MRPNPERHVDIILSRLMLCSIVSYMQQRQRDAFHVFLSDFTFSPLLHRRNFWNKDSHQCRWNHSMNRKLPGGPNFMPFSLHILETSTGSVHLWARKLNLVQITKILGGEGKKKGFVSEVQGGTEISNQYLPKHSCFMMNPSRDMCEHTSAESMVRHHTSILEISLY